MVNCGLKWWVISAYPLAIKKQWNISINDFTWRLELAKSSIQCMGFVWFSKKNMCDVGRIPNAMDHPIPRDIPWYTLHDRARLEMVSGIGFTGRFTTFWQRIGARMGYWWINLMGWPYFMEGWLVWWPILAQKMVLGYLSLTKCLHKMIYGITDYVWYNYIG